MERDCRPGRPARAALIVRASTIIGAVCALIVLGTSGTAAAAATTTYAPLTEPGPPLSVPAAQLQASLVCQSTVAHAKVEPVLLNPATGVTAQENYSWNWEPALTKLGIPWCAYTAPYSTLGEIQTSGEYLVYAIRTMYALAGRKIAVMGHSQGGMSMRWALRFWPDTRAMVDDVIGFSGSNHGTTVLGTGSCGAGCPPADWEQTASSPFIAALNSDAETFPGISYTEIWTHTDEVVQPNGDAATASAALHTGGGSITDVATQDLCSGDVDEHLLIGTVDPVAYALAIDALTHPGPADVARVQAANPGLCSERAMPGVNYGDLATEEEILKAAPGLLGVAVGPLAGPLSGAPETTTMPPLACYATASCTGTAAPQLVARVLGRPGLKARRRGRVRIQVRTLEGSVLVPVPGVVVSLAGAHAKTNVKGIAMLRPRPRAAGRRRAVATLPGANPAGVSVRVRRA